MTRRIIGYAERRESTDELPSGSALVLREIFLHGEIAGVSPRTGQTITRELLTQRLVLSNSPKGPLRLGSPSDAAASYFPNLYPAGAE